MAVAATEKVHHSPAKAEKVRRSQTLSEEMLSRRVVSLVGFRGVPATNLQSMRKGLKDKNHSFQVVTNSQISHALTIAAKKRKSLAGLVPLVSDQTAVLISDSNPFVLHKELKKTRNRVAPKGGEIAPEDIWIHAGETSFKPGPIVAELQHAGFPAAIEKGKVIIKKDALIVKMGNHIGREAAQMLARLDIKPIEVGLILRAAVEEDLLYSSEALSVDLDAILGNIGHAQRQALVLALKLGFLTPETLPLLLVKAKRQALVLAMERGFISPDTISQLIGKAMREAVALKSQAK